MSKNLRNQVYLVVNSLSINNITINAPQGVSYTLTLPTSDGTNGQVLTTDGNGVLSWTNGGSIPGVVTSVGISVPTFLSVSGSPITSSGTIAITGSSTGTGSVVLATNPTIVSSASANPALTITNPGLTPFMFRILGASTGGGTPIAFGRFGVNETSGNFGEHRFNYAGSANTSNNFSLNVTPDSFFRIFNNSAAPFSFVNPSGPVSVGAGGLTSTGTVTADTFKNSSGSFTTSSAVTIALPTSGTITIKLSFILSTNLTELIISGNTLANGNGTNLPALEPSELFTSSAGINTSTFLGQIVLDAANNFTCYASIDIDLSRLGGGRLPYVGWSSYTRSAAGTVRGAISGYITDTALSITLTPTAGTTTGNWTLIKY